MSKLGRGNRSILDMLNEVVKSLTAPKAFRGQKMSKNELNGSALLDDVSFDKPCSTATVDGGTVELEDTGASGAAVRSAASAESSESGSD